MKKSNLAVPIVVLLSYLLVFPLHTVYAALNAWKEPYKSQIIKFVKRISSKSTSHYLNPEKRVAVFDMDGTLITERPTYFEVQLAFHNLKQKIKQDSKLLKFRLYQAIDNEDWKYIEGHGKEIMIAYFKNRTWEDLSHETRGFYKNAFNEQFQCKHDQLVYKPMVDLIDYLRKNEFQVYIVSTSLLPVVREIGKISFKLTSEKIIGSVPIFTLEEGKELREARFSDNYFSPYTSEEGKSLRVIERIGIEPILAVGNSSGDRAMMMLTDTNTKLKMILLLDHDDTREEIYHKESMLKLARERGWTIIPMSQAFKEIFTDCPRQ